MAVQEKKQMPKLFADRVFRLIWLQFTFTTLHCYRATVPTRWRRQLLLI